MGAGVFASCERLRHLTTQLTAACSYRGALVPPAGLRRNVHGALTASESSFHMCTRSADNLPPPPMLTSPSSPLAAHPSLPACHLQPPSCRPAVPPSYRPTTHSSSVLSNFFSPFALFLCPLHPGTITRGFTSRYVLVYTQVNSSECI